MESRWLPQALLSSAQYVPGLVTVKVLAVLLSGHRILPPLRFTFKTNCCPGQSKVSAPRLSESGRSKCTLMVSERTPQPLLTCTKYRPGRVTVKTESVVRLSCHS